MDLLGYEILNSYPRFFFGSGYLIGSLSVQWESSLDFCKTNRAGRAAPSAQSIAQTDPDTGAIAPRLSAEGVA